MRDRVDKRLPKSQAVDTPVVQPQQTPEINTRQEGDEEYKLTELGQIMDDLEQIRLFQD